MRNPSKVAAVLALCTAASIAQAGVIEDLLSVPAIRSLLARVPELQAVVQRCADPAYSQRNTGVCQQAEQASRLAKLPPELRAVLSNPAMAASLRELCVAAQPTVAANSYLCMELARADGSFRVQIEQQRMQQNRESTDR